MGGGRERDGLCAPAKAGAQGFCALDSFFRRNTERSVRAAQPRDRLVDQRLVRPGAVLLRDDGARGGGGGFGGMRASVGDRLTFGGGALDRTSTRLNSSH